jgi:tetraacyldisaccharide 4'-kinase
LTGERGHQSRGGLLSGAYGRITTWRRAWYARQPDRARRLGHRVISVGNLSMGGSGKTPVVAALARLLRDRGERPAILTRGYGRREPVDGVLVVSDGERVLEPVSRSGDEPQMLARTLAGVPVLVCADRYLAGVFAERHFAVTVSILDDGFQHLQLARNVDLLMLSASDVSDAVVPSGRLREPLETARVADALLVPGSEDDARAVLEVMSGVRPHDADRPMRSDAVTPAVPPAFRVETKYGELQGGRPAADRRVVAFAGIARPERFFDALRTLGYDVVRELTFPDHHWYRARDLQAIQSAARDAGTTAIVTTEKDAVRCDLDVAVLPMRVEIEPPGEFADWLMGRLR